MSVPVPSDWNLYRDARLILGVDEEGDPVEMDLYGGGHMAVQGMTRSGKSVFLMNVLANLTGHPAEAVEVCGVDPTGVLLGPWEFQSERIAAATDSRRSAEVVASIVEEMDRRIAVLRSRRLDKFEGEDGAPYLIVVLDEYPGTLARADLEDRGSAKAIRLGVQRLVLEGAKVAVRVVIAAQKALSDTLGSEVRSNLSARVSFRVDSPESVRLLHPSLANAVDLVDEMRDWKPGVGLWDASGRVRRFRADCLPYSRYLEAVEGSRT